MYGSVGAPGGKPPGATRPVSLTKAGDGGLYLTGANTHSGGTTISGGTLYAGCYTSTGTLGTGAVVDNASLVFWRTDSATFANAISGTGTVTQSYGTVTLTGANTYSGGTIINMNTTLRVGGTSVAIHGGSGRREGKRCFLK